MNLNSMRLIIDQADNGFTVTHENTLTEDGKTHTESTAFVFEGYERTALEKLLTHVAEAFGEPHDRRGKENVRISWDGVGSKVEQESVL